MRSLVLCLIAIASSAPALAWDPVFDIPRMSIEGIDEKTSSGVIGEEANRTMHLQAENSSLRQLVNQQQNMLRLQEERIRTLEAKLTTLETKK